MMMMTMTTTTTTTIAMTMTMTTMMVVVVVMMMMMMMMMMIQHSVGVDNPGASHHPGTNGAPVSVDSDTEPGITFDYGEDAMKQAIRKAVKICYLLDIHLPMEPQLRFDRNGSLQHTELLIMNVQWKHTDPDGKMWQRVGRWMRNGLMMRDIVWPGGSSIPPTGRPARSFLRIATLQEQPYVMYKPRNKDDTCSDHAVKCRIYERDENKKRLSNTTVPRCCVGLSVDLLRVFGRELNFDFDMFEPADGNWGALDKVNHKFSLFRSFWLIWAMLFSAAVDTDTPKGVSSRFLANIWALFAVVFLASYTANLAAFMITKEEYYDLSGIQDWRLQNPTHTKPPFKYATITAGSTETNIRNNHPKMFAYMRPLNKATVNQGIEAVKQGEIQAFIYDATVLEYYAGKDPGCKLRTVGNWYAMTGYGIAFPHGKNPWVPKINKVIFELQQNGEMERLQKFWLAGACYAKKDKKGVSNKTLGILNFTSAFILLGGGVLLSVLLLLFEFLYFRFGRRCVRKAHKCNCCGFISLSLSKSLTVEDTVRGTMSLSRRKRCRDEICDTQIWRLRHELDLALLKIENLQNQLSIEPSPVEMEKMARAVGRDLDYSQHNGWPRRQAARDVSTDNSLLGDDSCDSRSEGGGTGYRKPEY
nr:hypothetical protein BaRGS_008609 [Batillaria attramentaria]